ncbi:hypothetical protein L581_4358 [Serratia fonticola AU-AP2C]|nr:hypothetical protein L581_4358 [Serratia fonticola AU-AP2C]
MRRFIPALVLFMALPSIAAIQCGAYRLTGDGMTIINGETVTSQKITYLGAKGDDTQIKMDMTLMPASDGFMYGFEFIKRDGKAFLNVELLQANRDAPRLIGSFDCKRVSD